MIKHSEGFTAFSFRQSQAHAEYFRSEPLSAEDQSHFEALARASIAEQAELEQTEETVDFDTFVGSYQASILAISN
jgi:glutamate--cysteine ligase